MVSAYSISTINTDFIPIRAGTRIFMVDIDADELKNIKGEKEIYISGGPTYIPGVVRS